MIEASYHKSQKSGKAFHFNPQTLLETYEGHHRKLHTGEANVASAGFPYSEL